MPPAALLCGVFSLTLGGCGESVDATDTGTTETGGATECVPGQQQGCDCYDDPSGDGGIMRTGENGIMTCDEDGYWGECMMCQPLGDGDG